MLAARPAALAALSILLWGGAAADAPEADASVTLAAAPVWVPGDWWQVRFQDGMGLDVTHRLVVAGSDKGEYLVGLSRTEGHVELLVYHTPYFGRVDAADLSYHVHNQPFHPLQFPLVEGSTWRTQFNDLPLEARVTSAEAGIAEIEYAGDGHVLGSATYDAAARTLTRFSLVGHGSVRVESYGRGFACDVHYPERYELLFLDSTPGLPPLPPTAAAQEDSFREKDVDRPYERAAVVLSVGGEQGAFAQQVVPPDGSVHEASVLPQDRTRWRIVLFETDEPVGTWRLNSAAAGQGMALAEAIGFDARVARLSGLVPPEAQAPVEECASVAAVVPGPPGALVPRDRDYGPWIAGSAVAVASLVVAVRLWPRRLWAPWLVLFAKIPPERVLDHRVRQDIHDLLKQQPGLTTQEIRRNLEIGWGNTVHHLAILERAGIVAGTRWGHNRNWFLRAETPPAGREAISALRRDAARKVFERIEARPGISQEDLARELSLHHSTVIFHVERLMQASLISKRRDGQRVRYYPGADARAVANG